MNGEKIKDSVLNVSYNMNMFGRIAEIARDSHLDTMDIAMLRQHVKLTMHGLTSGRVPFNRDNVTTAAAVLLTFLSKCADNDYDFAE